MEKETVVGFVREKVWQKEGNVVVSGGLTDAVGRCGTRHDGASTNGHVVVETLLKMSIILCLIRAKMRHHGIGTNVRVAVENC